MCNVMFHWLGKAYKVLENHRALTQTLKDFFEFHLGGEVFLSSLWHSLAVSSFYKHSGSEVAVKQAGNESRSAKVAQKRKT